MSHLPEVPPPQSSTPSGTAPSKTVKMRTIAAALDLSIATVSRALRGAPGLNPKTRARVVATAAHLGYELPNHGQADESDNALEHIGVLIQTPQPHAPAPHYLIGMSE